MPNSSVVCCDTNLVVNWATQPVTSQAWTIVNGWITERRRLVAPLLLRYEATNVLFRREKLRQIPPGASRQGLDAIFSLNMTLVSDPELHFRALELAHRFQLGAAYDAHYLALAEREDCELWTGDRRLFNAVHHHFPRIHYVDIREIAP